MPYPLIGIDSTLADEECESVRISSTPDDAATVYLRVGEDGWGLDDMQSDPLHTQELLHTVKNGFGETHDKVECFLARETVVYEIERGAVSVRRTAREDSPRAASAGHASAEALADALGIPRSRRKVKLKQAFQFGRIVEQSLPARQEREIRILDLACGRSYLGFVLTDLLASRGWKVVLHGVDSDEALVAKCRQILARLQWGNCTFEVADLASYSVQAGLYDVVMSLHGCDTLTDDAIRIACQAQTPLLFAAPCCQHELRHLWKTHPLQWISRYGLLEQRLADVLTDGFRCLVLEALGYRVNVLRFTAPEVTPKNLLIRAKRASGPRRDKAAAAWAFLKHFGVRPKLAAVLEAAGLRRG
jgi:2-polyprenyl-3-methyl-5-hydroxy-6-metoxy-1,4-benzoquinol methylase